MAEQKKPSGPDLTAGISASSLRDKRQILGHVGDVGAADTDGVGY